MLCLSEHLLLAYIYLMTKRTRIAHLDEIGHDRLFSTIEAFLTVRSYNNSESLNITALPHIKIQCSLTNFSRGMLVREFQDCHLGSHVGYKLMMFYVILNLHVALMTWHMVLEEMLFEKKNEMAVSRACDLGYLNEGCLASLNFHVAPMSPAKS